MRASVLGVLLAACAGAATAEGALTALTTGDDVSGWPGRWPDRHRRKRVCTGALIAPDLVLSAAHCVYDRETGALIGPSGFIFWQACGTAGPRPIAMSGAFWRIRLSKCRMAAAFTRSINDVALLALDQPIRSTEVIPFEVDAEDAGGGVIGIVSYAFDRAEVPSLEQLCEKSCRGWAVCAGLRRRLRILGRAGFPHREWGCTDRVGGVGQGRICGRTRGHRHDAGHATGRSHGRLGAGGALAREAPPPGCAC